MEQRYWTLELAAIAMQAYEWYWELGLRAMDLYLEARHG